MNAITLQALLGRERERLAQLYEDVRELVPAAAIDVSDAIDAIDKAMARIGKAV